MRSVLSTACLWIGFLALFAYNVYLVYLGQQIAVHGSFEPPPKGQELNPIYYLAAATPWIERYRKWERSRTVVWIGAILLGVVSYLL